MSDKNLKTVKREPFSDASPKNSNKSTYAVSESKQENGHSSTLNHALIGVFSAVIILATYRNTFIWYFLQFWGACGDFFQTLWDTFLDRVGDDPYKLWVWGPVIIFPVVYTIVGSIYFTLDYTLTPSAARKYKIQPGTNEPLDINLLPKILGVVSLNMLANIPVTYLSYHVMEWRGYPPVRELPTMQRLIFDMIIIIFVEEIAFFYIHRDFLHSKRFYKYFHKLHHEWQSPAAIAASYCHPVEHITCNLFPVCLGVFITGSHVATAYLWFVVALVTLMHSHCGYNFPFFAYFEFHDYHHMKFNKNFGVWALFDLLHGSYADLGSRGLHIQAMLMLMPKSMHPEAPKEESNQLGKK